MNEYVIVSRETAAEEHITSEAARDIILVSIGRYSYTEHAQLLPASRALYRVGRKTRELVAFEVKVGWLLYIDD